MEKPQYTDQLFEAAIRIALEQGDRVSIAEIQKQLRIGYTRAKRLLDSMEKAGLVEPCPPIDAA